MWSEHEKKQFQIPERETAEAEPTKFSFPADSPLLDGADPSDLSWFAQKIKEEKEAIRAEGAAEERKRIADWLATQHQDPTDAYDPAYYAIERLVLAIRNGEHNTRKGEGEGEDDL